MIATPHTRRVVLATALVAAAVTTVAPPAANAAPPVCGPLGTLITYSLNDRCDYGTGLDPEKVDDAAIVDGLTSAGLFATTVECSDRTVAPVVAVPDELLVGASDPSQLPEALAEIRRRLDGSVTETKPINPYAATVSLLRGTVDEEFLRGVIPNLQGPGWSADLNYLEPAQPNNVFRPGDNPIEAKDPGVGDGGGRRVLVVDSPAPLRSRGAPGVGVPTIGPLANYDIDLNGYVDEDHGHGPFVALLVKQLAPKSEVVLAGVVGGHVPGSARWSPMLFSDADVIAAIGSAFGLSAQGVESPFDVVNLSLGGTGCDGIASRLPLGRFLRDLADLSERAGRQPTYVAAAGNSGADEKHFPAAWRDKPTIEAAATAVDASSVSPPGTGDEIRAIHSFLEANLLAVGSRTAGARDPFSNCGDWVNAVAAGADTVSQYPSPSTWASWSGTSFATARVSAAVAGGQGINDVLIADAIGAC